jgi:hypothetical protein
MEGRGGRRSLIAPGDSFLVEKRRQRRVPLGRRSRHVAAEAQRVVEQRLRLLGALRRREEHGHPQGREPVVGVESPHERERAEGVLAATLLHVGAGEARVERLVNREHNASLDPCKRRRTDARVPSATDSDAQRTAQAQLMSRETLRSEPRLRQTINSMTKSI